jgi:hypothetical protein
MNPKSGLIAFLFLPFSALACAPEGAADDEDTDDTESAATSFEYDVAKKGATAGIASDDTAVTTNWGMGRFQKYGDVFEITDASGDGMNVGLHWRSQGRSGLCRHTLGSGITGKCDKDLGEGKLIEIRLGRCKGTGATCKSVKNYKDWTGWESGKT